MHCASELNTKGAPAATNLEHVSLTMPVAQEALASAIERLIKLGFTTKSVLLATSSENSAILPS